MEGNTLMRLQPGTLSPKGVVAIIVDGSTLLTLHPQNTIKCLAECMALLHDQRGGPMLRADIKLVSRPPLAIGVAQESAEEPGRFRVQRSLGDD